MCPDKVRCNDDSRGTHGIGVWYDGHYRDQLDQYFATPHREVPSQRTLCLCLAGIQSARRATHALHNANLWRKHGQCPAAPETVVSKYCRAGSTSVSPPPQNDMN
jgi:hypothetical protein